MSKLNQWLTLVANLSVVAGIIFLAAEMRQNTEAIQAQTRDSMTEKQMQVTEWIGTDLQTADFYRRGSTQGWGSLTDPTEFTAYVFLIQGYMREWENSHYQYEHGLFSEQDFQARKTAWRFLLERQGYRDVWASARDRFSPSFRAEIDRIVAEVEQAQ